MLRSFHKFILILGQLSLAAAQITQVIEDVAAKAYPFPLSQVSLTSSRWMDNQNRTLAYLKYVDVERLLRNFRANHRLPTNGAAANGGWDAPNFPFRTHFQGHFLTAWAHCYATLQDSTCKDRADYFVAELAKCQDNNAAAGFSAGYLSGFPESEFSALEARSLSNGNVPYYAIHKTMAGLFDVWRHVGSTEARDVLLKLASWANMRTGKLSYAQMQAVLGTEFGGMNDILTDLYRYTGDKTWLTAAIRFDHAAVFDPLASNQDLLSGLHANTQVPKWIGAALEYKATGDTRYLDIARNAWDITVNHHSYAIGGNSQAEHFRPPDAISSYLSRDTAEACNTYNMLKLTRELFLLDPSSTKYFDFYEQALMNHLLGQQNKHDGHGHVTYFTPLNPGGRRGVGPAWGGGTWSEDYNSFWCCQGTGLETNTKLMDSIYFYDQETVWVNLFTPSRLLWTDKGVSITQETSFPISDTTSLKVSGSGAFKLAVRIPEWTSEATIMVNTQSAGVSVMAGSYTVISRTWNDGDEVVIRLPMTLRALPANDNESILAVAYGPTILSGNFGSTTLSSTPTLSLSTIQRKTTDSLLFAATVDGKTVELGPFYDAHGFNYVVYWKTTGSFPAT